MSTAEKIIEEAKTLPEPLAAEVLDFIAFLRARYDSRDGEKDLQNAQSPVMTRMWSDEEDDIWNDQ